MALIVGRKRVLRRIWDFCALVFIIFMCFPFSSKGAHICEKIDSLVYQFTFDFKKDSVILFNGKDNVRYFLNEGLKISENASSPASFSIQNPLKQPTNEWNLTVFVKGNLSSGNYIRYYLLADQPDFSSPHYGYHLQIDGTSGNHYYKLYRQNGARRSLLFTSQAIPNQNNEYQAEIKILRNEEGVWQIKSKEYDGEFIDILLSENQIKDFAYEQGTFLGGYTIFTQTRKNDFTWISMGVSSNINLNEPSPIDTIPNDTIPDIPTPPQDQCTDFRNIIFNELMVNPNHNTKWVNVEYIELYNRTENDISLNNWELSNKNTKILLQDLKIKGKDYLLLIKESDSIYFENNTIPIGYLKNWPTLTNTGNTLKLNCSQGNLIDSVSYTDSWYTSTKDKQGGKSLERINPHYDCSLEPGWLTSIDSLGGTPGFINSVSHDSLLRNQLINSNFNYEDYQLELTFNNLLDNIQNDIEVSLKNQEINEEIKIIYQIQKNIIRFNIEQNLNPGEEYTMEIKNLKFCNTESLNFEYKIKLDAELKREDILISEILFNPYENSADFVEIYNNSNFDIDLSNVYIGNVDKEKKIANLKKISENQIYIFPKNFKVITSNKTNTIKDYPASIEEDIIEISNLPSFPNKEGTVVIVHVNPKNQSMVLDSFSYQESMHHHFIKNYKGISLERVDFNKPANEKNNFISSSLRYNGATPGFKGIIDYSEIKDYLQINTRVFNITDPKEPLKFSYHFNTNELVMHMVLIDYSGKIIHTFQNKTPINSAGELIINQQDLHNIKIRMGVYTFLIEVYNAHGWKKKYKKSILFVN